VTPDEKAVQVWQRILDSYTMLDTNGKEISFVSPSNTPARLTIDCVKWIAASIEEAKKEAESDRDRWKGVATAMAQSFKKVWDWYESGDTSDSGLGHALAEGREAYSKFNEAVKGK